MAPLAHRIVVSTLAGMAGTYLVYHLSRDFEFVRYEPFLEEEVERRKRAGTGLTMRTLNECTLDLKPEAKDKFRAMQRIKNEQEQDK